jgi:hypothetical protein
MNFFSRALLIGAFALFLQPAFGEGEDEWKMTTLSDETLKKVQLALVGYQQCVNDKTKLRIHHAADSRAITDAVLKQCEDQLSAVKLAFDAERVPSSVSERYMRSRRTYAARNILRTVMGVQAMRSAGGTP